VTNAELNELKSKNRQMEQELAVLRSEEDAEDFKQKYAKLETKNQQHLEQLDLWRTRYEKMEQKNQL